MFDLAACVRYGIAARAGVSACVRVGVGVPTCVPTRLTRSRTALAIEESPKIRNKPHRKVPRAMHNLTCDDISGKRRNSKERAEI